MLAGGALAACALMAASTSVVTVNLPQPVKVGSTTLPSGEYSISPLNMTGGDDVFVIRSAKGAAITMQAQKLAPPVTNGDTHVVLAKDGDTWSIDKLFVDGAAYQFAK